MVDGLSSKMSILDVQMASVMYPAFLKILLSKMYARYRHNRDDWVDLSYDRKRHESETDCESEKSDYLVQFANTAKGKDKKKVTWAEVFEEFEIERNHDYEEIPQAIYEMFPSMWY